MPIYPHRLAGVVAVLVCAAFAQAQPIPQDSRPDVLVGTGPGSGQVRLISGADLSEIANGYPFGADFRGGVRVAAGDLNGDGVPDLITAQATDGGQVRVFDGVTAGSIFSVAPFGDDYRGGVHVAAGDLDGDGRADLIVGQGSGGLARAYSGATHAEIGTGAPFGPVYTGGVTVAAGDVNGDGRLDMITGTALGGFIRVFDGMGPTELASGFPYGMWFTGGVYVAAGDISGDGRAEVVISPRGGSDAMHIYDPATAQLRTIMPNVGTSGIHTAVGDFDQDGRADVFAAAGAGSVPIVRLFSGADGREMASGYAFVESFRGGVFVATTADPSGTSFTSANTVTFRVGDTGDFTVTTRGRPGPITQTGTLPGGVTFSDNGDGTATLAGTPAAGAGGTSALTFRAGPGGSIRQDFTLRVEEAAAFTSAATATFLVGTAETFAITTNGFPRPTLTSTGALPAGITFTDNGDGTARLAGTAATGGGGTYTLTFTGANGIGTDATQTFTLEVRQAPTFTSAATTTFNVGAAGTFSVTTSGTPSVTTLTRGGAALPSGVTYTDNGDGTGTLSGTPVAGTGGTYAITFTADNGVGAPVVQNFTLQVNDVLAITSANAASFGLGVVNTFAVTTTGFPRPALTRTGAALPAGVTFVDNGDGSATLAGTPAAGSGGTYAFTITASNGVAADVAQSFTLTVTDAPRFTSAPATTFIAGTVGTFTITTAGTPAVTGISSAGVLPSGVTFVDNGNGTAALAGTPAAGTGGAYTLTLTATNGSVTGTQAFTLTVTETPSITSASSATFPLGSPSTFTVTTGGFPTPALAVGGAALPGGVTFTDNGDGTGTLSGTPAAGTGGTYALTFTATNSVGASTPQAFTLTVDSSPAFTSAAATAFTVGTAGTFTITTTGSPAVTTITQSGTLPSGVTFTDNGGGTATLAGTPAAGTGGAYAMTFTADNGVHAPVVQNFTLTVNQAPAVTSAAAAAFTIGTAGSFTVTTTGFPPPTLAIGGAALPSGVSFIDNGNGTGTLSGTPAAGTGGTYAIAFTPSNAAGTGTPQAFSLTVNGAPAITSANTTTLTVGAAGTFTVTTTGTPTPALTAAGALPSGVTFTDNGNGTATLAGTPAAGGTFPLTITAANGIAPTATQAFTLQVNEAPTITSATATTFVAGTAGIFTVTTSGSPAPAIAIGGAALPSGVSFTDNGNGTGTLSGTPAAGTGGTYALSFTATNGAGASAPQAFTLTVNQAPAITSAASTAFQVGVAGSFTVTTTGFPANATVTRTGAALPAGVTFVDNGDGTATLSGTPAAGTAAAYALTLTASNGVTPNAVQSFTLNVNQAPAITSANSATFTVGTAGTFTVTTTGFPIATVSEAGTLPTGVTFTPATRVLAGTATQTGTFPLVLTATNGISPDATQNFTLNVVCPVITLTPAAGALPDGIFNTAYAQTFSASGGTGPYTFTVTAGTVPAGTTLASGGGLSGTLTNTGVFSFTVTATDDFACTGSTSYTSTIRPNLQPDSYTGGVGNTEMHVGQAGGSTPAVVLAGTILDNDQGPSLTITTPSPAATTNGGQVFISSNGAFTYRPQAGDTGNDSFSYTVSSNGVTNSATVTIGVTGLVWYVSAGAAGGGTGTSYAPFDSLDDAATPSASGSSIYVHTGSGTTTGNVALDTAQVLHGQGETFILNSLTIPAGTRPTLSGTVTLASNTAVRGLNFNGASPAMNASGVAFTLPTVIEQVNVAGGTSALSLTNVTATGTGAVTVSNASFTNTSAAEIAINGGNVPLTISSTVTISSNAGRSIDIQNRTGGTVTFNTLITDTAQGIFLNLNTGSTINFTGGLSLATGTNPAFTATGGGTVTATQNNTTIVNQITTTTGTAVNVANTTIGAAGLTFRTISANGAASGIILNNTGAAGGLTVSGNGGTCTSAGTCSGGAIQNTTADGLSLVNTSNVSLTRLFVGGAGNHGINTTAVNTLSLVNARVQNSGNADNEHGLNLINAAGTITINGTAFDNAAEDLVHLENNNTNVTLNVTNGSQFSYPASVAATANAAILLLPGGTASITASIQNSTFTNIFGSAALIGANLLNSTGTQTFTFSTNTINVTLGSRGSGVVVSGQELTTTNVTIVNNVFTGAGGNGVISIDTNDTSRVQGTVSGNTITNAPGIGMFVAVDEGATGDISVDNNTITNVGGDGIQAVNFGGAGVSTMQLAITNNQVNGHSANTAVSFVGGISFTNFEDAACVVLRGNTVTGTPASPTQCGGAPCVDHYLEEVGGTMTLEEVPDTAGTTASAAYVNAINDAGPVTIFGVIDLTNGAACNVALTDPGVAPMKRNPGERR